MAVRFLVTNHAAVPIGILWLPRYISKVAVFDSSGRILPKGRIPPRAITMLRTVDLKSNETQTTRWFSLSEFGFNVNAKGQYMLFAYPRLAVTTVTIKHDDAGSKNGSNVMFSVF